MLLTLDLATVLGWTKGAVEDTKFKSGYFRLPSTGPDIGKFALAYDAWLGAIMPDVTEVVFEAPILPKKTRLITVRKLTGLAFYTEFLCAALDVRVMEAHLQSIKKAIGGHGRAEKVDMIAAVRRYGYDVTEENEADAVAVRLYTIMTRHKGLAASFGLELGLLGSTPPVRRPMPARQLQLLGPEE